MGIFQMAKLVFVSVLLFLFSVSVFSDTAEVTEEPDYLADLYLGGGLFFGQTDVDGRINNVKSGDAKYDQSGIRLHLGKKVRPDLRFQVSIRTESLNVGNFASLSVFENDIYGFGFDVIKTFFYTPKVQPFISFGASYNRTLLRDETYSFEESMLEGRGFKVGAGFIYQANQHIELDLGLSETHQ